MLQINWKSDGAINAAIVKGNTSILYIFQYSVQLNDWGKSGFPDLLLNPGKTFL